MIDNKLTFRNHLVDFFRRGFLAVTFKHFLAGDAKLFGIDWIFSAEILKCLVELDDFGSLAHFKFKLFPATNF